MSRPLRVLLVDDDEDQWVLVRSMLREVFGDAHTLEWQSRWEEGLRLVLARGHDVVLLDHHLGGRTGVELLAAARGDGVRTPIVMLTGTGSAAIDVEAMRAGADDYLEKDGLGSRTLERALRYALDRARTRGELLEQRQELEARNAELARFAEGVAHDLRQPLQTMSLLVDLLHTELDAAGLRHGLELVADLSASTERMRLMLAELLEFAKAGGRPAAAEAVDVVALLDDLRRDLRSAISEAGALVDYGAFGLVVADRVALRQVLLNLLSNAIKFRGDRPCRIVVEAVRTDTEQVLRVRDNGVGVSAADARRIFGAFERAHRGDRYPGTGLGLAICERLVRRSGGRIWVEPAPGGGSVFSVALPVPPP